MVGVRHITLSHYLQKPSRSLQTLFCVGSQLSSLGQDNFQFSVPAMDAICRALPGYVLVAYVREARLCGKLGPGRGMCPGTALATRGRSIPAHRRVCGNAVDGGAEDRASAWEALPSGTEQLLQQLVVLLKALNSFCSNVLLMRLRVY